MNIDEILSRAQGNKIPNITYDDCVKWWSDRLKENNNDYMELLDNFRIIFYTRV